ncbi:MAG TPA: sarcosine oxidase subunit alpha [Gammaproteobacteria bacterium]|nr:sarcosine oxidase subunit alpha [Gammaproteobacteria bacterium]
MTRLANGGVVNRQRRLNFRFNGQEYQGLEGDTLASALVANDVKVVGRSFKYHRPRGLLTCGPEEPNALVQLLSDGDQPNLRATEIRLTEGLEAKSVNCWPSARFDLGAVNDWLSPIIPAGFYYKTFMARPWDFYSRFIRKAAGLGRLPTERDRGRYERVFHHTDLLVVGAGPAGLRAAQVAAISGADVMLVDMQMSPGGHLLFHSREIEGKAGAEWIAEVTAELKGRRNVTCLQNTTATGYYDHNMVLAVEHEPEAAWLRERLWHIRAKKVVIATGAVERPLVFPGNDRPGVMLTDAVARYVSRFAAVPGQRAVVYTNNSTAYEHLELMLSVGISVEQVVDLRATLGEAERELVQRNSIEVVTNGRIIGVEGRSAVRDVRVAGESGIRSVSCDLVCHSGGWNPLIHLYSHAGGKSVFDQESATFIPGEPVQAVHCVGAANGTFSVAGGLGEAAGIAGSLVEELTGKQLGSYSSRPEVAEIPYGINVIWPEKTLKGKAFVDFQNDVTTADIALAVRENFQSIEHVKRYTTAGMAVDQGKVGNPNVIGLVTKELGEQQGSVGTTTFRPPFMPVSFGVIGGSEQGQLIIPARTTPITRWNIAQGAAMDEAGANFRRPFYFPRAGESMDDAVAREARAARNACGIYDGTPLGTFELQGPDTAELLNRLYTNRFDNLLIGRGRFGLMLREDGRFLDDGVTFRVGPHHYLMSCGTGAAGVVYAHIDRLLQTEWTDLKVYLVNVSAGLATMCVCGPYARDVLGGVETDIDFDESFRFMDFREGRFAGVSVRIARVSYTGELSFEINVARRHALMIWTTLMNAGQNYGITPIGSETSGVLRIEKGFVSPGHEGDNITNPFDAGMAWIVDMEKPDFIGKRSLRRDLDLGGERQHVVGLLPDKHRALVADGSALLPDPGGSGRSGFQGHVTAACFSPTLERTIALALLKDGHHRHGEKVLISGLEQSCLATVTAPVFFDPQGQRMRG